MKKIALVTSILALSALGANAADMAPRYSKAPLVAAAPVSNWTGCYLGGNVGYGWQAFRVDDVTAVPNVLNGDSRPSGVVGGGQVGCDYQVRNWVFGLQGMFDWTNIKGGHVNPAGPTDTFGLKVDRYTTFTGRIGYAVEPQVLVYLKGGAAWVRDSYTDIDPVSGGGYVGTAQATRNGWTIGGGAEYAFAPNWSVFAEYDYMSMGRHNTTLNYTGPGAPAGNVYTERFTENLQTVLVGLNFRFGAWGR